MRGEVKTVIRIWVAAVLAAVPLVLGACNEKEVPSALTITTEVDDKTGEGEPATPSDKEEAGSEDYTEGLGDTFTEEADPAGEEEKFPEETESVEDDTQKGENKDVDLIFFMGQSNMSGAGGDASAAPYVPPEAGVEFRAISDPETLCPIVEPFGINENNPTGLHEYPDAKKGSLVSAFVNEYHKLTGRRVVAVSISMGATDMNTWITDGVREDVKMRCNRAVSYLNDNGYTIGHMYALWLHGESDALGHTDPEVYKSCLDDVMRPLFIAGVRKVFIIVPGRTIDYKDIFRDIVNVQKEICADSDYYAMATTILSKVSTEYMLDQYHYNQHVLNLVGMDAAASVAYYTEHSKEKIVYDYREGKYIIPDGIDPDSQEKDHIDLGDLDINEKY